MEKMPGGDAHETISNGAKSIRDERASPCIHCGDALGVKADF
jgi:hypothetical protein